MNFDHKSIRLRVGSKSNKQIKRDQSNRIKFALAIPIAILMVFGIGLFFSGHHLGGGSLMAIVPFISTPVFEQLTVEQKSAYGLITDKTEKEAFEFKAAMLHEMSLLMKSLAAPADTVIKLKALQDKIDAMKIPDTALIEKTINEMGLSLKALQENPRKEAERFTIKSFLQENKAKIEAFMVAKSGQLNLEFKATETSTDINGRDNYFTWHEGGMVGQIPVRKPYLRELFRNATTANEYIKYIDQDTIIRDAKNVALCGVTTSNTKVTFKVFSLHVDKVRDFTDVCLDMLSDFGFVQGEIQRLLDTSLSLKIDNDLLFGTGVSPILHGIAEIASTFNASATGANYHNSVADANLIDLVSIMGAQIRAFGQQNMWNPNIVLMNPRDLQGIKGLKNTFGDYIRNNQLFASLFVDASGTYFIDGIKIVENPNVPQDQLYMFDSSKGTVYARPGIGIEFAYENRSNFETETVTMKLYERLNLLIRNVDANAFMHVASIAAAKSAIDSNVS